MNQSEIQKIFQTVVKNVRCPKCGKRYSYENVHIVSSTESIYFLQLECKGHMPMLASVAVSKKPKVNLPATPISVDEVIESYKIISKINSVTELFK